MQKLIILFALFIIFSGCAQEQNAASNQITGDNGMGIAKGDKVRVEYTGSFPDGTVFDKSEGKGPLEFTTGNREMIEGFDEAVIGMKLNDEKTITIPPEKAYGAEGSGQRMQVPLGQIQGDGNVIIGSVLTTSTGLNAKVVDINQGIATVELVHPLAGKTLRFWIKIVSIEKA